MKNNLFIILLFILSSFSTQIRKIKVQTIENSYATNQMVSKNNNTMHKLFENSDHNQKTLIHTGSDSSPLKLSKEELGRFTWAFLHSVAASMPADYSEDHEKHFTNLLNAVAFLYPCRDCGRHFTKLIASFHQPEKIKRRTSINYVCNLHNEVNKRLNKPIFDCDRAAQYWGGDCGCNNSK